MTTIRMHEKYSDIAERIKRDVNNGAKHYNTVYRQASTNLLVVAGTLLAFSTIFVSQLLDADMALKIMVMAIIVSLVASLAFGVVQQLIEAEYFRKDAIRKLDLVKRVSEDQGYTPERVAGMLDEIDNRKGRAVTRWASVVQLCLLGFSLLLMIATAFYFLFV